MRIISASPHICALMGMLSTSEINLETECYYRHATVNEFCQWLESSCTDGNPLKDLSCQEHWCYADYKHMCEIFEDKSEIFQAGINFDIYLVLFKFDISINF